MSNFAIHSLATGQEIRAAVLPEITAYHPDDICHLLGIEEEDRGSIWYFVELEEQHHIDLTSIDASLGGSDFYLSDKGILDLLSKTNTEEAREISDGLSSEPIKIYPCKREHQFLFRPSMGSSKPSILSSPDGHNTHTGQTELISFFADLVSDLMNKDETQQLEKSQAN